MDIEHRILRKEYFTEVSRVQELITKICLRYLCLKDFQQTAHSTIIQFNTRAEKYAFLQYAALYMPTHLLQAQPGSQSIVNLCNALLDPSESRWLAFSEVHGAWNDGNFENFMEKFRNFYPNPLYYASYFGMFETVKYLLGCGTDINITGGTFATPLQAAASSGQTDLVRLLLNHGADVDLVNLTSGFGNALQAAAAHGHEGVVNMLLDHGADVNLSGGSMENCIIAASASPRLIKVPEATAYRIIERLIDVGAKIESASERGLNALHEAAHADSPLVVGMLLKNGADINASNNGGNTALHIATQHGYEDVVRSLLNYRAVPNPPTEVGCNPSIGAATMRSGSIVEHVHGRGVDTDAHDSEQIRLLHRAATSGEPGISRPLVSHGASMSQCNKDGFTALHMAAYHGLSTSIKLLLNAGADVNRRDHLAETALLLSIKERHAETARELIEAGADPNILDYYGRNCFDWAASLRLDVPLLQAIFPKTKDPPTVMDMHQQGMLHALHKPNKFCDAKAIEIRQEVDIDYGLLGRLLLGQKRRQDACTAFDRKMQRARETGIYCPYCDVTVHDDDGDYGLFCDLCGESLLGEVGVDTVYFVCTTCAGIDLCSDCMVEYETTRKIDKEGKELCENHDFVKVPSDGWQDVPAGKVNKQGETEDEWLARLATIGEA